MRNAHPKKGSDNLPSARRTNTTSTTPLSIPRLLQGPCVHPFEGREASNRENRAIVAQDTEKTVYFSVIFRPCLFEQGFLPLLCYFGLRRCTNLFVVTFVRALWIRIEEKEDWSIEIRSRKVGCASSSAIWPKTKLFGQGFLPLRCRFGLRRFTNPFVVQYIRTLWI